MADGRAVSFLAEEGLLPAIVDVVLPHINLIAVRHTNGDGLVVPSRLAEFLVCDVFRRAIFVDLDLQCVARAVKPLVEGRVVEATWTSIISGCRGFLLLLGRAASRVEGAPVLISVEVHDDDNGR